MKLLKWIFGITFLLIIVAGVLIFRDMGRVGHYAVINKSGEPVVRALVSVCGQRGEFENISPEQHASATYIANCEGHYTVEIEFKSGRKLRHEDGYVTPGFDFNDLITVTNSEVTLVSQPSSRIKITIY